MERSAVGNLKDSAAIELHARSARNQSIQPLPVIARLAIGLEIFLSLGALFGGAALILGPDGHLLGIPSTVLHGSLFNSFLIPGILLFVVIGLGPAVAALLTLRRSVLAPLATFGVGVALVGWITAEMLILAGLGSLAWAFYLVLGASIAAIGLSWLRGRD